MKYIKVGICVLLFLLGIGIGILIKHWPILTLNKEIKIYEILNLILTALIAVLIPFFIKKWIEDDRQIKNNLVNELRDTFKEFERVKEKICLCYMNRSISVEEKNEITILFENSDAKFTCLKEQFIAAFDKETKNTRDELDKMFIEYWKYTTSNELSSVNTTVISESYFHRHNEIFKNLESLVKKTINTIHRL